MSDYDENYFTTDVEQDYIHETGKMPYLKKDKNLSKDFINWLEKKADLEKDEEKSVLKELEKELEELKKKDKDIEKVFHTWDKWCLIKLKKLGKTTLKQWADAMGWSSSSMEMFVKNNEHKLITKKSASGEIFYKLKSLDQLKYWLKYENKKGVVT